MIHRKSYILTRTENAALSTGRVLPLALLCLLPLIGTVNCSAPGSAAGKPSARADGARRGPLVLSQEYIKGVNEALGAKRDVWGEQVLARPEGPTYDNVKGYLVPLMHGDPDLTDSGTYYIPFGQPNRQVGSLELALHVADGSQFYSGSPANNNFSEMYGNTWNIYVGAQGDEMYGSSLSRLKEPHLADGYPILQTQRAPAAYPGGVRKPAHLSPAAAQHHLCFLQRERKVPGAQSASGLAGIAVLN